MQNFRDAWFNNALNLELVVPSTGALLAEMA